MHGKSKSEVARDHGVTPGTVRNRLAKLREPLRAVYRDYVHSKKDGYDTFSGVTHDERDEALAVSSTRTCLHEPSLDPMLAGRVPEAYARTSPSLVPDHDADHLVPSLQTNGVNRNG